MWVSLPGGAPREALAAWLRSAVGRSALNEAIAQGRSAPVPLVLDGRQDLAMLVGMKGVGAEALQMAKLITVPLDPYLRPFQKLQRAIVVTGLASLVLALLLALTTARSVTAPLARLTEAVGKLAEGGRPDLPNPAHQDEVGALAKGFRVLLRNSRPRKICSLPWDSFVEPRPRRGCMTRWIRPRLDRTSQI